ncbi:hypothetical protein Cme02nite_05550 [Catellatospora methionotrophica]|uniref:Uncharacterized protein n=1 Tax=Catellatospora methionotrophica TaxID=121620 RepID=A0A8J3L5M3_9ACTN|nr:hypothetical protein [Catellatospora methionotrophica]GIG12223.1 hypothetical protein Cme02nite_05550 [Catellatospora methionotrophica]
MLFSLAVAAMFALMGYFAFGRAVLRHDLAERGMTVDARGWMRNARTVAV